MSKDEKLPEPQSYLVAECGNSRTNVLLFDVIEGAYRLVGHASASTTLMAPWSNIMEGIVTAVNHLSQAIGRQLLSGNKLITPQRGTTGVDRFLFIASAAAPLSVILVGLSEDVSLTSARHALYTVYANEVDTFSLTDPRSEEEQVAAIMAHKPDLIFLTGGTDGGADQRLVQAARTVSLGINMLLGVKQVSVLYAGNAGLRATIRRVMGEVVPLYVAENVRPTLETERLDEAARAIGKLYETLKIKELPGIHLLRDWGKTPPVPTSRAFASMVQYFATLQPQNGRVLGLEVGTESVTLVAATADQVDLLIRSDLGMGHALPNLLKHTQAADIAAWMPEPITQDEIRDFILNKSLYPQTRAMSERDFYLEQAIVRELVQTAVQEAGQAGLTLLPFRLLLLRGQVFENMPRPAQVIAALLDALQPTGIFGVVLDQYGVLPALGAVSVLDPLVAVQTLESKVLTDLGWVVVPTGKGKPGQKALHVVIESEEQGAQYEGDVAFGSLEVFMPGSGPAKVTLKPEKRFDIGLGPGRGTTLQLNGSLLGLVVDARPRPLRLPQDESARRSLVRQWYSEMGG